MTLTKFTDAELLKLIIESLELVDADHWADPGDMASRTLWELKSLNANKATYEFRLNWKENGESAFVYENNHHFIVGADALNYVRKALEIHDLDNFLIQNKNIPLISIAVQLFSHAAELEAEALNDWVDYEDTTGSGFLLDLFISLRMAAEELNASKETN